MLLLPWHWEHDSKEREHPMTNKKREVMGLNAVPFEEMIIVSYLAYQYFRMKAFFDNFLFQNKNNSREYIDNEKTHIA